MIKENICDLRTFFFLNHDEEMAQWLKDVSDATKKFCWEKEIISV